MKTAILLALFAITLASSRIPRREWMDEIITERQIRDTEFRSGREYVYKYNGQLATGIPGSSEQHSATRIQAVVSLVFKTHTTCLLQLTHVRVGKLNTHIPTPRAMIPFMAFEQVPIEPSLKSTLILPVKFTFNKGMISQMVFDGAEEPWSANVKRGVLNMLQVNLQRHRRNDLSEEALITNAVSEVLTPKMDFFSCIEETIEGECETFYTITSEPNPRFNTGSPILNVTKTINFEKCSRRPEIKYNFRFTDICPTCEGKYGDQEKVLESSTISKFNISGTKDAFLIESARVESQYNFVPYNEQANVVVTYVNQTLVLMRSGPVETRVPPPSNPIPSDSQMIYTPDWDILKEKFFMEGDESFLTDSPYSKIHDKVHIVSSLLRRLVRYMSVEVEEEAPRQFNRLVKVLRMCKLAELSRIHETLYKSPEGFTPEQQKKIQDLLVDAIAVAGTKDCVKHIIEKTKARDINPVRSALAIKKFMDIRVVSRQQIELLLTFCESELVKRNPFLKQSCYLAVGSMINALCAPNEDKLASEFKVTPEVFCPRSLKERYVEKLFTKLRSSPRVFDQVLYLKTIANAGLDLSVFPLEKIIKNVGSEAPYPDMLRMLAVDALRQLTDVMPRKLQKILMPIYMNKYEKPELRIICFHYIMQTQPERAILDMIAKKLFTERSTQVASFVFTHLQSLANSTNPCEKRVAKDLQLSLRHAKFLPWAYLPGYSKYIVNRYFSPKYNLGVGLDYGYIFSNYSYVPRQAAVILHSNWIGMWSKYLVTIGFMQNGGQHLLNRVFGPGGIFNERSIDQLLRRSPRSLSPESELKSIYEKLRIVPRESYLTSPMAMIYMKFKDQEYGFIPLSMDTMPESIVALFSNGRFDMRGIERVIESGYNMNVQTNFWSSEWSKKIPTTLGLPLIIGSRHTGIGSITGQVKLELEPQSSLRDIKLLLNIKPSFATTITAKMEVWSPICNSGLKMVALAKMFYPLHSKLELNTRKTPVELKLAVQPPTTKINLLKLSTRLVTYTRVWPKSIKVWEEPQERTIYGEQWNRVKTIDTQVGENSLGIKFVVHGKQHVTPAMSVAGTPFCPLSGPNKLVVTMEPGYQMPKEIVLKVTGMMFEELSESFRPSFGELFESSSEEMPTEHEQYYKNYEANKLSKHQLKIELFTKGSQVERKIEMTTDLRCGSRNKLCKFETVVVRSPIPNEESEPWKLRCVAETLYPETPYKLTELINKHYMATVETKWGPISRMEKQCNIKITGKRSPRQIELLEQTPYHRRCSTPESARRFKNLCSPVSQYDRLLKASMLTKFNIELDYNMGVKQLNWTNSLFRAVKYYYYMQTDVAQISVNNPRNKVRAVVTLDPINFQYVNMTIKMPNENMTIKDMPLPLPLVPVNVRRHSSPYSSFRSMLHSYSSEYTMPRCTVNSRRVVTFDAVEYSVPLTTCYAVLAKDCSPDPEFAVLLKRVSPSTEHKKLKIITPHHKIVIKPTSEDEVELSINGVIRPIESVQPIREHGHVICAIERQGPYVKVTLPETGLKVYFDGITTSIKMSQQYRGVQCGLCGHFDREPSDEFRTATNELTEELPVFLRSYLHEDSECQMEDERLNNPINYRYSPLSMDDEFYSSEMDVSSSEETSEGTSEEIGIPDFEPCSNPRRCVLPVTKVIEHGHELCFSKTPVPQCPRNTYPMEYKHEKKVVYCCLPRSDPQAEVYLRRALRMQVVPEVDSLPASFTEVELIPERCSKY